MIALSVIDTVGILGGIGAGAVICTWSAGLPLGLVGRSFLVFFSMKVAGDALRAILRRDETHYFEDLLGDMLTYACLAVVSAAASWIAYRYLGGSVEPVFPGAVAHAVLTAVPGREDQRRAARG